MYTHTHTHIYVHTYIHKYMCVCVSILSLIIHIHTAASLQGSKTPHPPVNKYPEYDTKQSDGEALVLGL